MLDSHLLVFACCKGVFVTSRRFFIFSVLSSLLFIKFLPSNYLTGFLTTTLVTITQQSHQTTT
jgi:hypothetical protein